MALNGNRFKISERNRPCPECKGYPPLKPFEGRLRPDCAMCQGEGYVPRETPPAPTALGSDPNVAVLAPGTRRYRPVD